MQIKRTSQYLNLLSTVVQKAYQKSLRKFTHLQNILIVYLYQLLSVKCQYHSLYIYPIYIFTGSTTIHIYTRTHDTLSATAFVLRVQFSPKALELHFSQLVSVESSKNYALSNYLYLYGTKGSWLNKKLAKILNNQASMCCPN